MHRLGRLGNRVMVLLEAGVGDSRKPLFDSKAA